MGLGTLQLANNQTWVFNSSDGKRRTKSKSAGSKEGMLYVSTFFAHFLMEQRYNVQKLHAILQAERLLASAIGAGIAEAD